MISALDNHLLRAYLGGEMDESAAEAFEILMIERPELAELVDADTALSLGLAAEAGTTLATSAPPATALRLQAVPTAAEARPRRAPAPRWLPLAAAASVALVVGAGLARLWPAPSEALVPTTLLSVDRLRSSSADVPKLRLPAGGQIVLSVPVAAGADCAPTVRIVQSGVTLQAAATPDDFGFANLGVAATRLAPGKADVSVLCGSEQRAHYPVEFVRVAKTTGSPQ